MSHSPDRPALRAVVALVAVLSGGACDADSMVDSEGEKAQAPASAPSVVVETDKSIYAADEPIVMSLQVTNTTDHPITLQFSSGQRYDFTVQDAEGKIAWRWSEGRAFTMALGTETLDPGQSLRYEERFTGHLDFGAYQVSGILTVTGDPMSASVMITVR